MAVLERITLAALDSTDETADCVLLVAEVEVVDAAPWPVAVKGRKVTGTCAI